jgi:hypothetical protein
MQEKINNLDDGLCYNKKCPIGFICINGKCLNRVKGEEVSAQVIPDAVPMILRTEATITGSTPAQSNRMRLEIILPLAIGGFFLVALLSVIVWRFTAGRPVPTSSEESTPLVATSTGNRNRPSAGV